MTYDEASMMDDDHDQPVDYLKDGECIPEVTNRWAVSYLHTADLADDKIRYSCVWTLNDNYGIRVAQGGRGWSCVSDDEATGKAQQAARNRAAEFDREYDLPAPFTTTEKF